MCTVLPTNVTLKEHSKQGHVHCIFLFSYMCSDSALSRNEVGSYLSGKKLRLTLNIQERDGNWTLVNIKTRTTLHRWAHTYATQYQERRKLKKYRTHLHIQHTQLNAPFSRQLFMCRAPSKPLRHVVPLKGTLKRNLFFETLIFPNSMVISC